MSITGSNGSYSTTIFAADRLAEVPHPVEGQHRLVGEFEPVALVARDVLVRQHRMDAGRRQRLRDVDRVDQRMRVRAPQRVAPEHPRIEKIARVGELAGDLRDRVDALDALADPPDLDLADGLRAHARPAASRTASKIFA
jgi:hypothetical protein